MNKRLFYWQIILFVLMCSCTSKTADEASSTTNDSIQKYLGLAKNESLDSISRNRYNNKAFSLVNLEKNDTLTRFYLSEVSYNYMRTKNNKKLKKIAKIHFKKSIRVNDTLNLARYYRFKAGYFKNIDVADSALFYYIKSEKFYKKTKDLNGLAIIYKNKSQLQYQFDDYLGANLSAQKAYTYFKNVNDGNEQYHTLIVIGNTNNNLGYYNNAISSFKQALEVIKKYSLNYDPGTCLNNIGNAYREQKKYNKAIFYFNNALKNKRFLEKDPTLNGFLLNNLSYCKLQLKDYSGLPEMLFKSIELFKDNEGHKESVISYIYLSNYFYAANDTLKSQLFAEKALKIAKHSNAPYYYLTALSNAGSIDHNKASNYIKEYHQKSDSLLFAERSARNQYYKIQLETDEISQEKDIAIKQKWIIMAIALGVILIIILLLIITRQRSKQKELKLLQSQQKANEEIYNLMLFQKNKEELARQSEKKRIALELHDGVMNKLASIRLNLNILSHKKDEQTIMKCLPHIQEIYHIEQEIRSISHDLNLEIFSFKNSFIALLNDFIASQNNTINTIYQLEIDVSIDWDNLSSFIKMNLYRIIQEASHNINKFAQAQKAMISLTLDQHNLCLSITDDGKGFDAEIITEGIGLKNIKQRVETLNGKFVINSVNNKSTSLNIAIPIN